MSGPGPGLPGHEPHFQRRQSAVRSSFALSASRSILLNANGGTIDTQGYNVAISSPVSGAGGLAKIGAGTLTLTGSTSFSGVTTITAGTLQLNASNALQYSTVNLAAGLALGTGIGAFDFGALTGTANFAMVNTGATAVSLNVGFNNASQTYSGVLSGTGSSLTIVGGDTALERRQHV